jgi:hypothetical protein
MNMIAGLLGLLLPGPIASGTAICETIEHPKAWFTVCELEDRRWIDAFGDYEDFGFHRGLAGAWHEMSEPGLVDLFVDEVDEDVHIARMVMGTDTVFELDSRLLPAGAREGSWVRVSRDVVPR